MALGGWSEIYVLGHRDAEGVDAAVVRKSFVLLYLGFLHRGLPDDVPKALHCEQNRALERPARRINALGDFERVARPALPVPRQEPEGEILKEPPQEFRDMVERVRRERTLPPARADRQADPPTEPTAAELEAHQMKIQGALRKARGQGFQA
jgi:hypothetical protein